MLLYIYATFCINIQCKFIRAEFLTIKNIQVELGQICSHYHVNVPQSQQPCTLRDFGQMYTINIFKLL
nr:MAG TPA: hypothetical protein [Caudoviricetes sp.]